MAVVEAVVVRAADVETIILSAVPETEADVERELEAVVISRSAVPLRDELF